MYMALAIFAGIVGLAVTGTAVYTAWFVKQQWKRQQNVSSDGTGKGTAFAAAAVKALLRWTAFDYAVLALFLIGTVFLLTDLIGMMNDRGSYPPYHFGYLVSGFVFSVLGMIFMIVRMGVVLKLTSAAASAPHDQHEPTHADETEQRV